LSNKFVVDPDALKMTGGDAGRHTENNGLGRDIVRRPDAFRAVWPCRPAGLPGPGNALDSQGAVR
jgi:hypothetical protein